MKAQLILAITLILFSVFSIVCGMHNIDLAYNMDSGCFDINFFNITQTRMEVYNSGFMMVMFGIFLSIGSAISFLFSL